MIPQLCAPQCCWKMTPHTSEWGIEWHESAGAGVGVGGGVRRCRR